MRLISIISPVHNEAKNVGELCRRIKHVMRSQLSDYMYEIVLVDDASIDETWQEISSANRDNPSVAGVRLGRSIGQHPAIAVGLRHAKGDLVVVMDGDLQDIPEVIPDFVKKTMLGFDAVYARKSHEKTTMVKNFFSLLFNTVMKYFLGYRHMVNSTFCLITKSVAESIRAQSLIGTYFPASVAAAAKKITFVDTARPMRLHGRSKYQFRAQVSLAFDAMAATGKRIFGLTALCQAVAMLLVFSGLAVITRISTPAGIIIAAIGVTSMVITALVNHELKKRLNRRVAFEIVESIGVAIT